MRGVPPASNERETVDAPAPPERDRSAQPPPGPPRPKRRRPPSSIIEELCNMRTNSCHHTAIYHKREPQD
eukprot:scaffold48960_cov49-Phaeocystis_antarctica.AAC.3